MLHDLILNYEIQINFNEIHVLHEDNRMSCCVH